jgi:DNA polymerase III epsilon subunit-like protein
MSKFNDKQVEFINSPIENMKVIGIPGGGKTRTIIEYILKHKQKGNITIPSNFLILTFSRKACTDFLSRGKSLNKTFFNTKNVRTIHGLAKIIMNKFQNKSCTSVKTIIIAACRALEDAINKSKPDVINNQHDDYADSDVEWSEDESSINQEEDNVLVTNNILEDCKFIVVDESQDISESQYTLIRIIAKILGIPIIMVGDPNQNIYQFQHGSDKYLRSHPGNEIVFVENYRSSVEIVDFINEFRPWNDYPKMISAGGFHGEKPVIHSVSGECICQEIEDLLDASPYESEDIAIIGPVKKSKEIDTDIYTNLGLSLIENYFSRKGINFIKYYSDENKDEFEIAKDIKQKKGHINLLTIHGSKGLEFKQVIVLNFHYYTYGLQPTLEKYNEFKYLWYVCLSRAINSLHIFVDKRREIWPMVNDINPELYNVVGNIKKTKILKHNDDYKKLQYSVSDVLQNLSDIQMYEFEQLIKWNTNTKVITEEMYDVPDNIKFASKNNYSALYGVYIEEIFTHYVHKKNDTLSTYILNKMRIVKNTIVIPRKFAKSYNTLVNKIGKNILESEYGIHIADIRAFKDQLNNESKIMIYIEKTMASKSIHENDKIRVYLESELKYTDPDYINELLKKLLSQKETDSINVSELTESMQNDEIIFECVLYEYQLREEKKYYLDISFEKSLEELKPYVEKIKNYINGLPKIATENFKFQKTFYHANLPIFGIPDIINKKCIIDIKFVNTIDIYHAAQVFLYALIRYAPIIHKDLWKVELWNLQDGKKYTISFAPTIKLMDVNKFLCKVLDTKLKYTVFIYDLETTGLNTETCEIIECHIREYFYNYIFVDNLVIPENPIPEEITTLTGITEKDIDVSGITMDKLKRKINTIFELCENPIFVAHNGTMFDHKIMQRLTIFPKGYKYTLDSKSIIGQFYCEKNLFSSKETSLIKMYREIVGAEIKNAHRAGGDVRMISKIFQKLEICNDDIVNMV